jgi:hypothetical protein
VLQNPLIVGLLKCEYGTVNRITKLIANMQNSIYDCTVLGETSLKNGLGIMHTILAVNAIIMHALISPGTVAVFHAVACCRIIKLLTTTDAKPC